ncbi:MAG: fatty acid desaturase [Bacteroidetes bacterium]|nr:MAG: fatty acid desaturase [Bacteroidota bacterium]REK05098.1 MAG: fatty acid desaturase [Bacteroidota bacterium]REK32504.1 MAG: fatty acid desaturase [Bacteroidota bacterium]REK49049.1 MAG: fatty acid desaturase [Bacteroidota bacterium]
MYRADFTYSSEPEPHKQRTKQILREHPDVRELIGKNPYTLFSIIFCVASMILLSWLLKDSPWWMVFLASYFIGAFFNHALFVLIHECSHNLLFKGKTGNYLASILANLPHTLPSAISFARYHLMHHSYQGNHRKDADLPEFWEAKVFGYNFFSKALWLLLFPIFQVIRITRVKDVKVFDGWIIFNWLVQLAFNVAIWYFFGPKAFFFLLLSFFFSVGLHPLGARWIQEHYLTLDDNQETYSYYGGLNKLAFNVGYHNEHHDFPSVPWNKLPEVRKKAPSFYESLKYHQSWTRLFFRFLFDPSITLFNRVLRDEKETSSPKS